MPLSLIPSFILYCFVSVITPGPANLCSLAAAVAYGRRPALRQWRGLFAGFALISLCAGAAVWFLGAALGRYVRALTWLGALYILWMAWNILRSDTEGEADPGARCGFLTGLLVQLTNAKVMIFCVTALTTYALPYARSWWDVMKIAAILPFTGPAANLLWLFAGASMQGFFRKYRRIVNIVMAASLALCAVSIVLS